MKLKKYFQKIEGDFQKLAKKVRKSKKFRKVVIGIGLFVIGLAVLFFSFNLIYQDKIFPHTYLGGFNFGAMRRPEAQEKLNQMIAQSKDGQLNYSWEGTSYSISLNELEVNYNDSSSKTVEELLKVGRTGSIAKIIKETVRSIVAKNIIYASFGINQTRIDDYLNKMAQNIDRTEKDATIEIRSEGPVVIPEEIGQRFEMSENKRIVFAQIGSFNLKQDLPLKVSKILPKIDSKTAQAAIPATLELMNRQLVLKASDKTYQLSSGDIAGMIEFMARPTGKNGNSSQGYSLSPEITSVKVSPTVEKIAQDVYQEPKDPEFKVSSGRVAAFQTGQTGYELDKNKAISDIIEAIRKNQSPVELTVKVTEPALSSDDPAKLGLKELIGEGSTSWRGSPQNRIHNLTLGAQNISGSIVKPGEEFSTVKAIGDISAAAGFLPELVIKNSTEVVPEIGGGLCQVSTTLFRAVLNSGLKITARTPHSFRVSYYEPPVGMDATIYDPAPDFRFINNMETPIFIWAVPSSNGLDFQIYGTKDGRKVEISDPVVFDYISPPSPVYTESGTLAAGEIRQTERATSGATASFSYKVTDTAGTVLQSEIFTSKYVPLPDSFLYGPGTPDIPGQEVAPPAPEATPAPTPTVQATTKKR